MFLTFHSFLLTLEVDLKMMFQTFDFNGICIFGMSNFLFQSSNVVTQSVLFQSFERFDIFNLMLSLIHHFFQVPNLSLIEILGVILTTFNILKLSHQTSFKFIFQGFYLFLTTNLKVVFFIMKIGNFSQQSSKLIVMRVLLCSQLQLNILSLICSFSDSFLCFSLKEVELFSFRLELVFKLICHLSQC